MKPFTFKHLRGSYSESEGCCTRLSWHGNRLGACCREQEVEGRAAAQVTAEQALLDARQEADARQSALEASRAEMQQLSQKLQLQQVYMP